MGDNGLRQIKRSLNRLPAFATIGLMHGNALFHFRIERLRRGNVNAALRDGFGACLRITAFAGSGTAQHKKDLHGREGHLLLPCHCKGDPDGPDGLLSRQFGRLERP